MGEIKFRIWDGKRLYIATGPFTICTEYGLLSLVLTGTYAQHYPGDIFEVIGNIYKNPELLENK